MKIPKPKFILTILILSAIAFSSFAQTKERSEIADRYKWDMTELYPSVDAWSADKATLQEMAGQVVSYKGKLTESAATLYAGLQSQVELIQRLRKVYAYPILQSNLDQRNQDYAEIEEEQQDKED